MRRQQIRSLLAALKAKGHRVDAGLTGEEFGGVAKRFGISFPRDLRAILATGLPVSPGFVHWRYGLRGHAGEQQIASRLAAPAAGVLSSVRHDDFWLSAWGIRPESLAGRLRLAGDYLDASPALIPIYSHRYLPSEPNEGGNPVLSVMQADICYYGRDLADYFNREFDLGLALDRGGGYAPKHVRFWSEVVAW